ncbi:MAG: AmmeMemoRadiSam system protein B [Melioribacter sp.]|nr:AmmeMemoRadiSam system protein B [Melioribacter sp.]
MKNVREPAVAGMFYPASSVKLKEDIQHLLDTYKPQEKFKNVVGIVSPHAGYAYSGKTAAFAYNAVKGKNYKTIIVISPSHREYFAGISIYNGDAYKTPLGEVPINKKMRYELILDSKIIFNGISGHRAEHAVEVQIPFMQMTMNDFSIVPIVMGDQNRMCINELSQRLASVMNDETLIVASSDLSHFYSKEQADKRDSIVEKRIAEFDYENLQNDLEVGKCEACGGGTIVTMMKTAALFNKKKSKVLSRTDSGDVTGDNSEVVGYLSAVVYS